MWKKDNQPAQAAENFNLKSEAKVSPTVPSAKSQQQVELEPRSAGYKAVDRSSIRKETGSGDPTIISVQTTFSGEISGQADLRIFGNFQGSIEVPKNIVTIEPSGYVKATINARAINIQGKSFGNVVGSESVHLVSTCTVEGDIRAGNVILDKGSTFNGSIEMIREKTKVSETKPVKPSVKQNQPLPATPSSPTSK